MYFYAYFNWSYILIILSSITVNYMISYGMSKTDKQRIRKIFLILGIVFNLCLLGYFKYMDFFIGNINAVFKTHFHLLHILLPLGISFFTFQQVAYIIDRYKNDVLQPNILNYCNFVTFFPQLIAGPIVLPNEIMSQFEDVRNKHINYQNLFNGLFIFSLGLAKKVLVADSIAVFANAGFDQMTSYTIAEAWLTSLAYTFQLYFDFSGYCDMAIGIGLMFNIKLPLNFNAPYRATNFQDFWKRWHITLNRFLTHYLYIPIGGNRKGEIRTLVNIMIVFLISGIWHGAGWTFIVWGCLHGIASVINRIWKKHGPFKIPNLVSIALTFFFVNIFWVFFRAESLDKAWTIIFSMFNNLSFSLTEDFRSNLASILPNKYNMMILFVAMIISVFGPTAYDIMNKTGHAKVKAAVTVVSFVVGVLFISRVVTFLYFNF